MISCSLTPQARIQGDPGSKVSPTGFLPAYFEFTFDGILTVFRQNGGGPEYSMFLVKGRIRWQELFHGW